MLGAERNFSDHPAGARRANSNRRPLARQSVEWWTGELAIDRAVADTRHVPASQNHHPAAAK
jgi:hypothetical protein